MRLPHPAWRPTSATVATPSTVGAEAEVMAPAVGSGWGNRAMPHAAGTQTSSTKPADCPVPSTSTTVTRAAGETGSARNTGVSSRRRDPRPGITRAYFSAAMPRARSESQSAA